MIQLINGNAFNLLSQCDGQLFDAVITDPPYASGGTLSGKQQGTAKKYTGQKLNNPYPDFLGDNMDQLAWLHMMRQVLTDARALCKPGAVCILFTDWRQYPALSEALQWAGWLWRGTVVWDKRHTARPQRGRFRQQAEFALWASNGALPVDRNVPVLPGVFSAVNVTGAERYHQTQKPLEVMRALIKMCVPNGHILDPFCGSGTTLEAARLEGYDATGLELSPDIAQIAAKRLGIEVQKAVA